MSFPQSQYYLQRIGIIFEDILPQFAAVSHTRVLKVQYSTFMRSKLSLWDLSFLLFPLFLLTEDPFP